MYKINKNYYEISPELTLEKIYIDLWEDNELYPCLYLDNIFLDDVELLYNSSELIIDAKRWVSKNNLTKEKLITFEDLYNGKINENLIKLYNHEVLSQIISYDESYLNENLYNVSTILNYFINKNIDISLEIYKDSTIINQLISNGLLYFYNYDGNLEHYYADLLTPFISHSDSEMKYIDFGDWCLSIYFMKEHNREKFFGKILDNCKNKETYIEIVGKIEEKLGLPPSELKNNISDKILDNLEINSSNFINETKSSISNLDYITKDKDEIGNKLIKYLNSRQNDNYLREVFGKYTDKVKLFLYKLDDCCDKDHLINEFVDGFRNFDIDCEFEKYAELIREIFDVEQCDITGFMENIKKLLLIKFLHNNDMIKLLEIMKDKSIFIQERR